MASFTDKTPTFNPYIAQQPVEAMLKVGMHKQAQYDAGYAKIQNSIDKIAGLDLAKDVDKEYLQGKLDQLGNDLNVVAAGDFSNFQLTNSVAGMAGKIGNDEKIQNAVASTYRLRQENALVASEKKAGTLTPDNLFDYQLQVKDYMDDTEVGSAFNGEYSKHFDVDAFTRETFNALKPDGFTYDEVFVLDEKGNPIKDGNGQLVYAPAMTRMMKKGILPPKVKATLAQIFSDPRVNKQLNITGKYNYRGLSPSDIGKGIEKQKIEELGSLAEQQMKLNIDVSTGKAVQDDIDKLQMKILDRTSYYEGLEELNRTNPDALKGKLYSTEVSSRYTTMFGNITTSQTSMTNPYWTSTFALLKERNVDKRWRSDRLYKIDKDRQTQLNWQADFDQKELENSKKDGKEGTPSGVTGPAGVTPTPGPQMFSIDVVMLHEQNYDKAVAALGVAENNMLWTSGFKDKGNYNDVLKERMLVANITRDEAISAIIRDYAVSNDANIDTNKDLDITDKEKDGAVERFLATHLGHTVLQANTMETPNENYDIIKRDVSRYTQARKDFDAEKGVQDTVEEQMLKEYGELSEKESFKNITPQIVTIRGEKYELSKKDIVDLAIYRRGTGYGILSFFENKTAKKAAQRAERRLIASGKGAIIEEAVARSIGNVDEFTGLESRFGPNLETTSGVAPQWRQVANAFQTINNDESLDRVDRKAEIINSVYQVRPNKSVRLLGSLETNKDKETIQSELEETRKLIQESKELRPKIETIVAQRKTLITEIKKTRAI